MQGYFTWSIPYYWAGGRGFQVYIESNENPLLNAFSASFRIDPSAEPSSLEVSSPASGVKWIVLEEGGAVIEWTSEYVYDSLHIDLYYDDEFLLEIASGVPVIDNIFTWTVPLSVPAGSGYQVYIESDMLPLVNDLGISFTINPSPLSPAISLDTPRNWDVGVEDGALIEWSHENLETTLFTIQLYHEDLFLSDIAQDVPADSLSFTWTVPQDMIAGRNYQVLIQSQLYPLFREFSADFRITEP